jgi:hypothetical protein
MATKATSSTTSLPQLLKVVSKLSGMFTDLVFSSQDGKLQLYIANASTQMTVDLPGKSFVEDGSSISIAYSAMEAALSKRKEPTLALKDGSLVITEGRTVVEIQAKDHTGVPPINMPEPESSVELKIGSEVCSFLNDTLGELKIEKIHPAQPDFRLFIAFMKTKTVLATFDVHQMAYIVSDKVFPKVRGKFNLPYARFSQILKDNPFSESTLLVSEDTIGLVSGSIKMSTITPPAEGLQGDVSEVILGKIKQLEEFEGNRLSVKLEPISDFLYTSKAVASEDAHISFSVTRGDKLTLKVVSSIGSASTDIRLTEKVTTDFSFRLDIRTIKSLIGKCKDLMVLRISDSEVFLDLPSIKYISALTEG